MARSRSAVVDYLVYLAVRALVCVVQTLDWESAYGLADFLAWLAYRLDKRHREVALDNLRHAFPDWTELRRDRTVRETYRHFSAMVVEMIRGPRVLRKRNLDRYFDYESAEGALTASSNAIVGYVGPAGAPALGTSGELGDFRIRRRRVRHPHVRRRSSARQSVPGPPSQPLPRRHGTADDRQARRIRPHQRRHGGQGQPRLARGPGRRPEGALRRFLRPARVDVQVDRPSGSRIRCAHARRLDDPDGSAAPLPGLRGLDRSARLRRR